MNEKAGPNLSTQPPPGNGVDPARAGHSSRLIFLIVAALLMTGGFVLSVKAYHDWVHSPEPTISESKLVLIKPGMSFKQIAQLLTDQGVISSPVLFRILAHQKGVTTRIQAGEYTFKPGFSPLQILDIISRGDVTFWKLAVPEGFDVYDIARRLSGLGNWSEERFLSAAKDSDKAAALGIPVECLEGYLFPAVYELRLSMTEEQVVDIMVRRGRAEKTAQRLKKAEELGYSWHQALTMASLIEKETPARDEMRTISGVFKNRLDKNMRLQSDPTAIYGLADFQGPITKKDLLRISEYNTYIHKGLPPGPICNPGAEAIDAALDPEDTDYLYFVADGAGRHAFAKSYIDHVKNVRKYRKNKKDDGT
jgi:UPF0755 protein